MAKQTVTTRHVRVAEDLAEKLGDILEIETERNSAEFLDPLIRHEIETRHRRYLPAINAKRSAEEQARKLRTQNSSGTETPEG